MKKDEKIIEKKDDMEENVSETREMKVWTSERWKALDEIYQISIQFLCTSPTSKIQQIFVTKFADFVIFSREGAKTEKLAIFVMISAET